MKFLSLSILLIIVTAFIWPRGTTKLIGNVTSDVALINDRGFAVVELFTSEGCSSCPSADKVVAKIQEEAANKPVYILAFHVDYWNRLGWKDEFSTAAFSKRQSDYADWLKLPSVYTPQVVVNGKTEFVGSEESLLRKTITTNLSEITASSITITDITIVNKKINLHYHLQGTSASDILQIAIVQKSAQTDVKRGENSGRTLKHVQVVRQLTTIPLNSLSSGAVTLDMPNGLDKNNLELIAFTQNVRNGGISAATKNKL